MLTNRLSIGLAKKKKKSSFNEPWSNSALTNPEEAVFLESCIEVTGQHKTNMRPVAGKQTCRWLLLLFFFSFFSFYCILTRIRSTRRWRVLYSHFFMLYYGAITFVKLQCGLLVIKNVLLYLQHQSPVKKIITENFQN